MANITYRMGSPVFPDATNTGVPAGTSLTNSGNVTASTPGQTVDALNVTGEIVVTANNVTIKRCRVANNGDWVIKINSGVTGVTVQDCELNGAGGQANGILNFGSGSCTFIRNNIHNCENGITPSDGDLLQDNYIHTFTATGSPHYDGVEIRSGNGIQIIHNTINLDHNFTGAVNLSNDFAISNTLIHNNLLIGGGYTVYVDSHFAGPTISNTTITGNHLGSGSEGYFNFNETVPAPTVSGNVDWITGVPVEG